MALEYLGAITENVRGGAFLYTNRDSLSLGIIGQISSLAEQQQRPYELLETFKAHPSVAPLVRGGKLREYSAHLIPEAGWAMVPKLYAPGMMVAGDAAAFCFVAGLYLEGMNYAMQSGLAAGETAIEACRNKDFSMRALSRYEHYLKQRNVYTDFKNYRHTPAFVNGERLQNLYPEVVTRGVENLFRVDGKAKRKIFQLARETLRHFQMKPRNTLRDLYQAARAYLW
jgi:electron transfer flavoprotein-quinone oxidoreductase